MAGRLVVAARLIAVVAILFIPPSARLALAQPQSDSAGASRGSVRDASMAPLPDATVVAQETSSSLQRVLDVTSDGTFPVDRLPHGVYRITATAPGFAPSTVSVDVPLTAPVVLTLQPAPIVEQVTVVSAARQEELRQALSTSADVISRARILDSGSQTVGELLREVPGVLTRRNSEGAGAAGEQIQGIDSRQVLVLIDGQPLVGARGIKSGLVNLDRESTWQLERIEVVKGSSSALYGSDAIGGVVNLISREATVPLSLTGELSGGSLGEVNATGDVGVRQGAWGAFLSLQSHSQDGFDLTPTTFDITGSPFERKDYSGRLRWQASPSVAASGFITGYTNHSDSRAAGELGPQFSDTDDDTLNANAAVDWQHGTRTSGQARVYSAGYHETSTGWLLDAASTPLEPGKLDQQLFKADTSIFRTIGDRQQLQAGLEFWRDEYAGLNRIRTDSGESATTNVAWGQYRVSLTDRVVATAGARVDQHSEFGTAFSPKLAANARITEGFNIRASIGRGFRAPDLGQLYYRFLNPSNLYQVIGNPDLTPEHSTSLQVGGEWATPQRRARVGLNYFHNHVTDLINSTNLGFVATQDQLTALLEREGLDPSFRPVAGRLIFTYRNVAEVVTEGVELDGEWALTRQLSVGGAYTYLSARDTLADLPLIGRHPQQGHARLNWKLDRIGLRANIRGTFYSDWVSSRATVGGVVQDTIAPGFALWDAFVSQRVIRAVSAFVAVDNLTDSQDPNTGVITPAGAPAPLTRLDVGRTARVGLRVSWAR